LNKNLKPETFKRKLKQMITNDDVIRACYKYHRDMMRELFLEHQTPAFQIALQNAEKDLQELVSELDEQKN